MAGVVPDAADAAEAGAVRALDVGDGMETPDAVADGAAIASNVMLVIVQACQIHHQARSRP